MSQALPKSSGHCYNTAVPDIQMLARPSKGAMGLTVMWQPKMPAAATGAVEAVVLTP